MKKMWERIKGWVRRPKLTPEEICERDHKGEHSVMSIFGVDTMLCSKCGRTWMGGGDFASSSYPWCNRGKGLFWNHNVLVDGPLVPRRIEFQRPSDGTYTEENENGVVVMRKQPFVS